MHFALVQVFYKRNFFVLCFELTVRLNLMDPTEPHPSPGSADCHIQTALEDEDEDILSVVEVTHSKDQIQKLGFEHYRLYLDLSPLIQLLIKSVNR